MIQSSPAESCKNFILQNIHSASLSFLGDIPGGHSSSEELEDSSTLDSSLLDSSCLNVKLRRFLTASFFVFELLGTVSLVDLRFVSVGIDVGPRPRPRLRPLSSCLTSLAFFASTKLVLYGEDVMIAELQAFRPLVEVLFLTCGIGMI